MIVIVPHQDIELKLIKAQKKIIKEILESANEIVPYAAMPLWIQLDFNTVQEAKAAIRKVTVLKPEFDDNQKSIICPVKIETKESIIESKLAFIQGLHFQSLCLSKDLCKETFPLEVKIFRLGECTSPSPDVFELSNTKWVKLT